MCPTKEWSEDRKDWMIDGTNFWTTTNWHAVWVVNLEWQRSVKDSWSIPYYWLKNELSKITNFWSNFYIYIPVGEHLEEVKRLNEFKTNLLLAIETNSKMWHQTNDEKYREQLHQMNETNRKKLKDIDSQLALYHK
jgi:hypothetical protein